MVRALSLAADKWHKGLVRVLGDMSGYLLSHNGTSWYGRAKSVEEVEGPQIY